jgi:PAS domain S-box-containing protein
VLPNDKDEDLRNTALRNVESILAARRRAEDELLADTDALQRKSEELQQQREWFEVTLSSIGDAVITTDVEGRVTFLNPAAEVMTGWSSAHAEGAPLETVFRIVNEETREPAENPIAKVLQTGKVSGLANHTALISKDGTLIAIEDSAAPIRDSSGQTIGAVMVFHDVTVRRQAQRAIARAPTLRLARETSARTRE